MPPASDIRKPNSQPSSRDLIFAVDTGGTKTAAWLVESFDDHSHRLLGEARTSAGNPLSVGFERASAAIHEALVKACESAGLQGHCAGRAILSIAGAANRDMTQRFIAWAREKRFAQRVSIVSDVLPILAGGTPDCCGVALISGTGSSAYGRSADGRAKRCGGWGYLLGDEGSGYAIGRAALQHTLRSVEEGHAREGLAGLLLDTLGVNTVTETTRAIYGGGDPRHAVAALATLVIEAAENGDTDAESILEASASELAALAARTAHAVGLADSGFPLAVSGGVLINSERLRDRLHAKLHERECECEINVVSEPLAGCVRLAEPRFDDVLVKWHNA
jgi:N-acetylglucosamine kinase-like BadF-type ATPase